jgi:rSAM/selenodomain-associated transferase 1
MAAHTLDDCALVIMAKAPRAGQVKTRLASALATQDIVTLYRCLIEDTVGLARAVGVPRIAVVCPSGHEDELARWLGIEVIAQDGDGLAAGLESAFRVVCGPGCGRVVALDGDSPHLPAETVRRAFALLERHDVVVGPTADGGYYLVGATRPHRGLFGGGALGTGTALQALLDRARGLALSPALTEECYDVDEGDDLARLAAELRTTPSRAPRTAAWLAAHPAVP